MKRFTDTEKWSDPWFRRLSVEHKLFWLYICDQCDIAGIWKVDLEMAEFYCGAKLEQEVLLETFKGRIKDLGNDKWWLEKFVKFQQSYELNPKNNAHLGIIRRLQALNISCPIPIKTPSPCQGAAVGLTSPTGKGNSKGTSNSTGRGHRFLSIEDRKKRKGEIQEQLNAQFRSANVDPFTGRVHFSPEEEAERDRLREEMERL